MWFFRRFWPKNWKGWPDDFETFHKEKSGNLEKTLENKNSIAAALHAQIGFQRSDQSQSSTPGQPTNGGPVLKYFLSETIHAQENGSRGTYFAKFWISNFSSNCLIYIHIYTYIHILKLLAMAMLVMMICRTIIFQTPNSCNLGSRWAREEP